MKSDRQAERIAAVCAAVGLRGDPPDAAPVAPFVTARGGEASREFCRAGVVAGADAGDGSVAFGGAVEPLTAAWQAVDRPATLARRQSTISGLLGAIQEQCAAISFSVQAPRTAFNSSADTVGAGAPRVARLIAMAPQRAAAPQGAAAAGASGACSFAATASTAVLQDAERLSCERSKHSSASLPPGSTPAQLAMKSERHAARIALRYSLVGCCAGTEWTPRVIETKPIGNRRASVERCIARSPLRFHLVKWLKPPQPELPNGAIA